MPLHIYKCSAGSGKTYTLVKEYVKILIENPLAFQNVLALTFTNKATQEMKERIINALAKLAEGNFAVLEKQLNEHFLEKQQYFDIQQKAGQALSNILHRYSEFTVTTIDSFFQGVLRSFAKELGHNIKYDIEMNSQLVLDNITDQLLKDIGKKNTADISKWLLNFSYSLINDGKSWKIENAIKNLGTEIFKENYTAELIKGKNIEDIEKEEQEFSFEQLYAIEEKLKGIKRNFEQTLNEIGKQGNEIMNKYSLALTDFSYGKTGVANFFNNLQKNDFEIKDRVKNASEATDETEIFEKWIGKSKLNGKKNDIDTLKIAVNSGLHELLVKAVQIIENESNRYYTALEILKNFYTHAVLFYLKKQLIQYRTDNSILLISDIGYFLLQIIADNESPFVYEKIGSTFKHILLDEFQDTSDFQWRNLLPLVKNALAESNQNALIVGDVKQSIYRWRGGKTELLLSEVDKQLHNFVTPETHQVLEYNYRSAPEIVEFNNAFFELAAQHLVNFLQENADIPKSQAQLIAQAYHDVAQKTSPNNALAKQGQVHITFLKKNTENPDFQPYKDEEENDTAPTTTDSPIACEYTLNTIKDLENEGFTHKDITILVRNNFEGALIAEYLTQNQVKVISSEALLLKASPKVQLLISALQFLALPNPLTHSQLLTAYLKNSNTPYEPHAIFTDFKKVLKTEPEQVSPQNYQDTAFAKIPPLLQFIADFDMLKQKPMYEMVELLVSIFKLNEPPDAYLQHFQDVVLQQTQKQVNTLFKFLEWWEQNQQKDSTSLVVPQGQNAVTVMTIHKAKGLEFTVVIMPFADWKLKPSAQNASILWVKNTENEPFNTLGTIPVKDNANLQKTLFSPYYQHELVLNCLDNLNLLYVAFTRPTHRLYVFASKTNIAKIKDTKIANIDKLIYQTLEDATNLKHFWNENIQTEQIQAQFQLLSPQFTDTQIPLPAPLKTQNLTQYFCEPYYNKIKIKDNSYSEEQAFGTQMHNLLKDIFIQKSEIEQTLYDPQSVIKQAISNNQLFSTYQDNAKKVLQNLHADPLFTQHILPKIQKEEWEKIAEETIIFPKGEGASIKYGEARPDYVLINHKEKELIIIDYKTGEKNEENNTQILNYEKVVRAMYKKYEVKTYLIYLNPQSVSIVIG